MIYNDGFPVDGNGLFLTCPKCGNTDFPRKAHKCSECGTSRRNLCMPAGRNQSPHVNAANARYCETCGAETILFHYGAVKKWKDAADELQKEARQVSDEPSVLPF